MLTAVSFEPPLERALKNLEATEAALREAERSSDVGMQMKFRSRGDLFGYSPELDLSEGSIEWLAVAWLQEFALLKRAQTRVAAGDTDPSILSELVQHAEELGRLEDRIWWRKTPVPGTETKKAGKGKSPEQLALERLPLLGRNRGRQSLTKDRQDFLRQISAVGNDWTQEAIAAEAIGTYAKRVQELWGCAGEAAEKKIVTFLRNHKLN